MKLYECVANVSEGRDAATLDACAAAIAGAGATLAHRTSDAAHNRAVLTFFGDRATVLAGALGLARAAVERIDLRAHAGEHPRIGALDVLPFVPFDDATSADAAELAREAAATLWSALGVPCYLYGDAAPDPRRAALATVRAGGFEALASRPDAPDVGDVRLHASAGATAVGARAPLVAYNVVLASGDLALARRIARAVRERDGGLRTVRALGLRQADGRVQVSCNVTDHAAAPLWRVFELVRALAAAEGVLVSGSELVGLAPRAALAAVAARALGVEVPAPRTQ